MKLQINFSLFADVDKDIDNGLTLCLALMTRSEVFFQMNDGFNGLNDLQMAVKQGLPVKNNPEYYAKLAKFYACEFMMQLLQARSTTPIENFCSIERGEKVSDFYQTLRPALR